MNIEERLSTMMQTKGINRSQLSKGANIPYTTIDGIFKKGSENIKLGTLTKLADYFNVSIDYLIGRDPRSEYNLEDLELLRSFEQFLEWRNQIWVEPKDPEKDRSSELSMAGEVR